RTHGAWERERQRLLLLRRSHGVREGALPRVRQVDGRLPLSRREERVQPPAEALLGCVGRAFRHTRPLAPPVRQQARLPGSVARRSGVER
ncbi:unnamed protein product, partial [Ectocarpus sp. 12 AP-2014]